VDESKEYLIFQDGLFLIGVFGDVYGSKDVFEVLSVADGLLGGVNESEGEVSDDPHEEREILRVFFKFLADLCWICVYVDIFR
jgi:hypothetical protein